MNNDDLPPHHFCNLRPDHDFARRAGLCDFWRCVMRFKEVRYSKFRLAYMCKRIDLERIKRSEYPMWFKLFVRLLFPIGLIVTWLINSELEDEHDRIVALYERYFGDLS